MNVLGGETEKKLLFFVLTVIVAESGWIDCSRLGAGVSYNACDYA